MAVALVSQSCGKGKETEDEAAGVQSEESFTLSPVLAKIRGRWVEEITSTIKPDIPTMRLFATANNTLSGRFLVGGGYADQGVAISIRQEGDNDYTLTLTDDELRPHGWIPRERVFKGTWDPAENTLAFKSEDGEILKWNFPGEPPWQAFYSFNIFMCKLNPTATPTPGTGGGSSGGGSSGGGSNGGGSSGGGSGGGGDTGGGGGDDDTGGGDDFYVRFSPIAAVETVRETVLEDPAPTPTRTPPPVLNESCGLMSRSQVKWARMSGSGARQ